MRNVSADIAVIGAGAAGMMAAITAASGGGRVVIYEKNERVGKKLLATGNGKCNLSNMDMDITHYYTGHPELAGRILSQFTVLDTIAFFNHIGMIIREKNGYLYPFSEQASTVLDILRLRLEDLSVKVHCKCEITSVERVTGGKLMVRAGDCGGTYDSVIVACGSRASLKKAEGFSGYHLAAAMGHGFVPVVPALVQLRCREEFLKALAGVRCQALLTLMTDGISGQQERGELQFTEYGISGIPVFQFSRQAAYALLEKRTVAVNVDFFPDHDETAYAEFIGERYRSGADKTLADFLLGMTNKKINQIMIRLNGCKGTDVVSSLSAPKVEQILWNYKKLRLQITAVNSFEHAQVCAGGIPLHELSDNLESLLVPHLYFVGEMLDVDGRCGGYNLQWAWSSGFVAGRDSIEGKLC